MSPWAVLGDSAAGASHAARGAPCEDAFRFRAGGDWLVVALADGAGSAPLAELGATVVCDELVRLTLDPAACLSQGRMTELLAAARSAVLTRAGRRGVPPRELASTAMLAVVGPDAAAFAQVGDGAAVVGNGGPLGVVTWPDGGEYVNATEFLTDDDFADHIRYTRTGRVTELAVFTDGLQRLCLDFAGRVPHTPFFAPLFRQLRQCDDAEALLPPFRAFLNSPRVNERTDDDKTLVLSVRRP